MLATLPVAAPAQNGFPFINLLILALVIAVLYPVQKRLRDTLSRRRRERWAREDDAAQHRLEQQDRTLDGP